MQTKLLFPAAVCALAIPYGGCSAPWALPFSRQADVPPTSSTASTVDPTAELQRIGSVRPAVEAPPVSHSGSDAAPDLSGVLDKLQQVRAIDPAAEQKLLEELRRTPAESWPLVAEQFRASLAYHEKLVATKQNSALEGEALPGPAVILPLGSAGASPSQSIAAERPSAPIGALLDPRESSVDGVSSEALARSTPYSMPAPTALDEVKSGTPGVRVPADFASDGPVYPLTAKTAASVRPATSEQAWPAADGAAPAVANAHLEANNRPAVMERSTSREPTNDGEEWQQLVARAADDLTGRVAKSPTTTAEVHQHVSLRLLRLLAGDTEKAMEPIPNISPTEHDYWSRQFFALATYLDHHSQPDDKRRAAASVTHLDEAVSHLRELGSLSVRNLSFCKNVYGYGAIEAYEADRFSPGEHVSLYVEVENYHSKSTEKGYCTSLGSTYEIVNDKGERVGGEEIPDVNDCCRSRRRDFHIQYSLALPEKLVPGQYRLQILIKDRQSDKIGRAEAAFEIKGAAP